MLIETPTVLHNACPSQETKEKNCWKHWDAATCCNYSPFFLVSADRCWCLPQFSTERVEEILFSDCKWPHNLSGAPPQGDLNIWDIFTICPRFPLLWSTLHSPLNTQPRGGSTSKSSLNSQWGNQRTKGLWTAHVKQETGCIFRVNWFLFVASTCSQSVCQNTKQGLKDNFTCRLVSGCLWGPSTLRRKWLN